ncbi:hypothetical protein [Dyella tabacisoli]|uniref:Glycosyltransferase family 2 protein n=1 Tax=Dyella tabacisoli TaxID=2282381 RepID=A0A369UIM9_9GAMM|nr:hypothetical protein [Dyella tabacisoli]RDD80203.1 hypothetical protein DVJ77_18860 [Dyella tabacisoli]
MEIAISSQTLQGRRLMVGTPMYGGQATGPFLHSLCELTQLCASLGVALDTRFVLNESLIPRARAEIAANFLHSDSTHLLFIDADIGFKAHDALSLLWLADENSPYDVIAGAYPRKQIAWDQLSRAVAMGITDADTLSQLASPLVFNPLPEARGRVPLGEPLEVAEVGCGFMLIRRVSFALFERHYPEQRYRSDDPSIAEEQRERVMYFDCGIDPATRRYLSEDYWFCQRLRAVGGHIWLCPWIVLEHMGSMVYRADPAMLARIGVPLAGGR